VRRECDVALIDPSLTWQAVEQRIAIETDPGLRRNLTTVLEHMLAEAALDIEGLMATLNDDPHYHFRNGPARGEYHGRRAVQAFYEGFAASGAHKLQVDTERLVVDRDCIITEGVMRIAFPGRTLAQRGIQVEDPSAEYLFEAHSVTIWPFDRDGRLIGEDAYFGGDGFRGIEAKRLRPDDVVPVATPS
jgi:hypothetical protein